MNDEFYIEESNSKHVFFTCLLILFGIGLAIGAYYYYMNYEIVSVKDVTVELGAPVPMEISKYLKGANGDDYKLDVSNVHTDANGNTDSPGEYSYKITKGSQIKKGKIFVKDTVTPTVEVQDLTVGLNEEFEVDDFVTYCFDLSGICYVSYANPKDENINDQEGIHDITLVIKDKYDNAVNKKVKLTVSEGASLAEIKATNNVVTDLYPKDDNWNETFTYKFSKGVLDNSQELDAKFLEVSNIDYSEKYKKEVINKTILVAYNKYGYALGISVRLEFSDETIYVTD